jgi:hypothetical protein
MFKDKCASRKRKERKKNKTQLNSTQLKSKCGSFHVPIGCHIGGWYPIQLLKSVYDK